MRKIVILLSLIVLIFSSLQIHTKINPTISVIMATYNRKDIVHKAIESIVNQTYRDFEFIIIDDASTDGTADIVQKYADKDDRIIFIRNKKNKGLVHNLNKGLDIARGKYIARMDDDDISYPTRFEKQIAYMEKIPQITVLSTRISPIDSETPHSFHNEINPEIIKIFLYAVETPISHPTIMIRHDFLKKHNIRYSERYKYVEDAHLYADILKAGGLIAGYPEVLLHYRFDYSLKSAAYLTTQHQNARQFQADLFRDFVPNFNIRKLENKTPCDLLSYMQETNPHVKLINQTILNNFKQSHCILDNGNYIFFR